MWYVPYENKNNSSVILNQQNVVQQQKQQSHFSIFHTCNNTTISRMDG